MPVFLCRWPNGDCSIVAARTKDDAIIELDEMGDAEGCQIKPLASCQVHFALTDEGSLKFERFGEQTRDLVFPWAYPALEEAHDQAGTAEFDELSLAGKKAVKKAVARERSRVRIDEAKLPQPETEIGREVKAKTGMPTVLVDRLVKEAVVKKLKAVKDEGGVH